MKENKDIIKSNHKFAKFMGGELLKGYVDSIYKTPEDIFRFPIPPDTYSSFLWLADKLYYHEDWNWLMNVKKEIESKGYIIIFYSNTVSIQDVESFTRKRASKSIDPLYIDEEHSDNPDNVMDAVYSICERFIDWYNKNDRK